MLRCGCFQKSVQRVFVASRGSCLLARLPEPGRQHRSSHRGAGPAPLPAFPRRSALHRQLQTVRPVAFGLLGLGFVFKSCPLPSAELSGMKKGLLLPGQKSLVGREVPKLTENIWDFIKKKETKNNKTNFFVSIAKPTRAIYSHCPFSHRVSSSRCRRGAGKGVPGTPHPVGPHHGRGTRP